MSAVPATDGAGLGFAFLVPVPPGQVAGLVSASQHRERDAATDGAVPALVVEQLGARWP